MKRKSFLKLSKQIIAYVLIFTLLSNTASASFANVLNTGYNNEELISEIRNGISKDFVNTLQDGITANTITEKVNNLYYDVMALYLPESELKSYGLTKEQLKNTIELKEAAKQLWLEGGIKGENAVLFLGYIIPSLSLAEDKRDADFDAYFIKEYKNYLSNKATYINDHIKKIDKQLDKKDDNAKELIGLRDIILGYAMVSGYPQDEKSVRIIALNSAITNLSPYIVETYVMVLLESGLYAELTEYIKLLSYFEGVKTDTNYENMFSAVMAAYMPSTYIKQTWNNESRYAPGPVSQKGYALKEDGTLYNIWEELPAIIAGYGDEGVKVLNDIFHNGLEFYTTKQANILLPEVHWKYGALIPFIIGSIGTNKIKRGNKIEMPERYNSLVKYFGANDVGLAEISLLNHKFYDIVDYNYYKRVQNVIAEPYIKEIEADKKGTQAHYDYVTKEQKRRNFDIYRTTSWNLNNGNPYNGTLYNEANKTGLLLRKNQQAWENGKQLLHAQLNFAMVSDIVMFAIYSASIYNSLGGLVENIQQNINILKMARSLRAGGEKGTLLKVMRGLRRDPNSYYSRLAALTKEAESAKAVKSVTTINNGATGTITWEEATGGVSNSKGVQYTQRGNNWIVAQEETAAAKTNEGTEAISAMSKFRQKGIADFNSKAKTNRYHARRELNNINKADRARRAAELDAFNNKSWLGRKWSILTGNYSHPLSSFSKFDTRLFKFANNFKITRYLITHPLQTVTAFSPLNASAVSVAHTPIINGGRAPVEIVYQFRPATQNIPSIFEFAGNKQLAASGISKASALPKPVNVAKTLPQVNPTVLGDLPTMMRSPVFASRGTLPIGFMVRNTALLSGTENLIWNYPFVAVRKAEDAAGGIKADDGEKVYGPSTEEVAIVSAETEKVAVAPQVSKEISGQVKRSLVPEFTSPLTINRDKQIRNFVGLAAASVAGMMMLGINPITTVGATGMLLAMAPFGGHDVNGHTPWKLNIFGNTNKKAKLNLSQEELQRFVNSFASFIAKDDANEESLINFLNEQSIVPVETNRIEHGKAGNDYAKIYKDYVAAFMALDFTKGPQELAKQFAFNTGLDKFQFGGNILIKKGVAKDGDVKEDFERINSLYISSKDFKLKGNESLIMDSYGNVYKLTTKDGKEVKEYYQNVVATQIDLPGLNMPIVVIGKTIDKLAVLNFLFMLMGFSSLGRFVNGPIKDLWPNLPEVVAMALGTGIYFTNLLAVPFKPLIDKLGAKKMVAFAISEIILASLLPSLFGMSGFTAINPTTLKLSVLAITSLLYGSAAAGLQQVVNTTANNMLGGKEAGYVTAGGQMFKSIGSLSTYLFYAVAVGLLGAEWPAMYWLMGIPGVIGAVLLSISDLPLQKSKFERLKEAADKGDKAAQEELVALATKHQSVKAKPATKGKSELDFLLSWGGLPILAAIMLLCGSETLVSVTTKGLMKGWLGDMSFLNNDALQMAITGIITMGPALLGRLMAKSLMKKYSDVPQYNQKMLLIAAAVATASAAAIKLLGPSAGLTGLLFVIASNMTLANFFTFEANIMKKYNNEHFDGKFDSLVGTLTTMGIVGCFLVPTLTKLVLPNASAFDNLIVPMLLIPLAIAIMIPHLKGANPFKWDAPLKTEDITLLSQEFSKRIDEVMTGVTSEESAQILEQAKDDMAKEMGISVEELNTFLEKGTLPKLNEESIIKLANFWGLSKKDMTRFLRGKNKEAALKKIQKRMKAKIQEIFSDSGLKITSEELDAIFQN